MKHIIYILILLSAASVEAASFNCSLAQAAIEKTICSNPEISKADETLSTLYGNIKKQTRYVDYLIKDQRDWLKERNSCKTESCILEKYKARFTKLNGWLQKEAKNPQELVKCTDRPECWPEGSAGHASGTLRAMLQKTSAQLKTNYSQLISLLETITEAPLSVANAITETYFEMYKTDFATDALTDPERAKERLQGVKMIVQQTSRMELRSLIPAVTSSALTDQQVSWEKYRSDECRLLGSLSGARGGWLSVYQTECDVNLTEARLRSVTSAIKCIEKIPFGSSERLDCLYQLAPLVNKL